MSTGLSESNNRLADSRMRLVFWPSRDVQSGRSVDVSFVCNVIFKAR